MDVRLIYHRGGRNIFCQTEMELPVETDLLRIFKLLRKVQAGVANIMGRIVSWIWLSCGALSAKRGQQPLNFRWFPICLVWTSSSLKNCGSLDFYMKSWFCLVWTSTSSKNCGVFLCVKLVIDREPIFCKWVKKKPLIFPGGRLSLMKIYRSKCIMAWVMPYHV